MKIMIAVLMVLALSIGGYRLVAYLNKDTGETSVASTPVSVMVLELQTLEDVLAYQGRVAPSVVEKISFKSSGRLGEFNGQVGEVIASGTVLAALDPTDMEFALEAADNQLSAAAAQYNQALKGARSEDVSMASISANKALDAVTYLKDKLEDMTTLYNDGIISLAEVDGLKLELSLAEKDLALANKNYQKATAGAEPEVIAAAKAQKDLAATNKELQTSLIEDGVYTLDQPRILIQKLYEKGELVPAGYPVAILRSLEQKVTLGVTGKDLDKVYVGQTVKVSTSQGKGEGQVTRIAEIPDSTHFLYEVEVGLDGRNYLVGEIAACDLLLGERQVMTIPVTSLLNDGIDYVYIALDGVATVRQVVVEDVVEGYAVITGLEPGDQMITSNLNRIHEQSSIHIEE